MYEVICIGASAGGMAALSCLLPVLPADYPLPVLIVLHRRHDQSEYLSQYLNRISDVTVQEACSRQAIEPGQVYIAPSGYHLLVERDKTLSLSVDPPVNYSIPSIDVLFESAASVYNNNMVAVLLTGANRDGCQGLQTVEGRGGMIIVQDPQTAESPFMPSIAIESVAVDHVLPLDDIANLLCTLHSGGRA